MSDDVIRVAHVIGSVAKGGVEAVVFNYYRFINKNKVQFDFIIDDDSPCEIPDDILSLGCKVFKTPSYKRLPAYIKSLKKIFKSENYKIVHSHMNTLSVFTLFTAKLSGVPVRIAHSHSTAGKGEFFRNVLKYSLRPFSKVFATNYFACSEYAGRWLFGNKVTSKEKVTIIKNAIDVSKFIFNNDIRIKMRAEIGLSDKLVIGHVGRFMPQKNHGFLIDVFNEIYKARHDAVLLLIGEGELQENIIKKVEKLNLSQNVFFLGLRYDVNEIYQTMDIFILPSLYEGLPVVGVEAQTAGLSCLFSKRITDEVLLTENAVCLDLNDGLKDWALTTLQQVNKINRVNVEKIIIDNGFDIRNEAEKLLLIYLGIGV